MNNEEKEFERTLKNAFQVLDAQIKIPDVPDAQTIFEHGEEKGKVFSFRTVRIAAAATIVVAIVGISAFAIGGRLPVMGMKSKAPEMQSTDLAIPEEPMEAPPPESIEIFDNKETEEETSVKTENNTMVPNPDPAARQENTDFYSADSVYGSEKLAGALNNFFANRQETKEAYVSPSVASFSVVLSKKRTISVEVGGESVSVTLYDTSGEPEVLTAFWVEGLFQSSGEKEGSYILRLLYAISKEEFESGYYLPMYGDMENGNRILSEDCVEVSEPVTSGVLDLVVSVDIESGSYEISAILS